MNDKLGPVKSREAVYPAQRVLLLGILTAELFGFQTPQSFKFAALLLELPLIVFFKMTSPDSFTFTVGKLGMSVFALILLFTEMIPHQTQGWP